jgi:RHH-type proline utilization regulon transcriptional repressor/proline dehydrogenase/delta 1-pyrroline-5-carboxylate dehydrogenase
VAISDLRFLPVEDQRFQRRIVGNTLEGLGTQLVQARKKAPARVQGLREVLQPEDLAAIPFADAQDVDRGYLIAAQAVIPPAEERARILGSSAQLLHSQRAKLMALMSLELNTSIADALADIRDAAGLCVGFGALARSHFASAEEQAGPTGEKNELHVVGRGTIACITVHTSPLASFIGQIAAAFAAGNPVVAKPASENSRVSALAVRILLRAGVPEAALRFLPGEWHPVGAALIANRRCAAVAFSGPEEIANSVNRALAAGGGPLIPLITGIVPHPIYLMRFANERTVTANTTAAGG